MKKKERKLINPNFVSKERQKQIRDAVLIVKNTFKYAEERLKELEYEMVILKRFLNRTKIEPLHVKENYEAKNTK